MADVAHRKLRVGQFARKPKRLGLGVGLGESGCFPTRGDVLDLAGELAVTNPDRRDVDPN